MCFKNNYSIHHCFGSWRYFENVNEKHEESTLRNYLKNIYFLRWVKDKYIRMKRKIYHSKIIWLEDRCVNAIKGDLNYNESDTRYFFAKDGKPIS